MSRRPAANGDPGPTGRPRRLLIGTTLAEQLSTSFFAHFPALREAGWEIHVVCAPGEWPSGPPPDWVRVHRIDMVKPIEPRADAVALTRWLRLLRRLRPDVVVGASPKGGLLAMVAARLVGVRRRIFLHRGARWETLIGTSRRLTLTADRLTVRSATDVVAVSGSLAQLLQSAGVTRRPATVLCGGGSKGVDLTRFVPGDGSGEDRSPFPVLGFVGRLAGDKGLDVVLAALDVAAAKFPEAALVVVGDVDSADPPPQAVLDRMNADPRITWRGWVTDVVPVLRDLDVLVFPSLREGLPNAVIEAAACGVPTVGWDVTGVRDAVDGGVTGRLVPVGEVEAFASAVVSVLASGRGAYRSACREWAQRFDQVALSRAWVDLVGAGQA
ncbi:MAG: glycosyltransferase [Actinobacteria bacterium]|nr:glycosyltransferase [Actinomycetota bacterium]